jgi:ubiquinone/menaquinone biosynthesis C-methylase UbiE
MTTATPPQPPPTPERFFNTVNAYQQTEAMKSAIELDLFTAIAEGNTTAAALSPRCNASERGIRILCDFLAINGFLTKQANDYALAPDAAFFLNRKSPAYIGSSIGFLLTPHVREAHAVLTQAIRLGGTAAGQGTLQTENPDWVQFAEAMLPLMFMPAQLAAGELLKGGVSHKVLDIAASHGIYGISVAKQNPDAQIYACDWSNVLEVGVRNANAMGVGDRYHPLPGSAFDIDFGTGYDLVLIPNFLHHFDVPTCTAFMRKVHAALAPNGRAAIIEFVPNPDRITPPVAAGFSMMMLATTPSGDAYTSAEFEKICKDAGFSSIDPTQPQIAISTLIVAHK